MATSDLVVALRGLVADPERVSEDHDVRAEHGRDISHHPARSPDVVVYAAERAEVERILAFANERRLPLVPFGEGTSVEGNIIPSAGGITLDLSRMNEVVEVRPDDFLVRVQPGVTRISLNERLAKDGLFFPPDPGADASIGGMVGTNASGSNAVRYGAMRHNVLGLEVVLADGTTIKTGGLAAKSSAGYDLTRLFVGSEGTLGVVTEATLKLHRLPQFVMAARVVFPDVDAAARAALALVRSGTAFSRIELVDEHTVRAVNAYKGTDYAEAPTLFLEFGGTEVAVSGDVAIAEKLARDAGSLAFESEEDEEARSRLWEARHHAAWAISATEPEKKLISTDVAVPVSAMPEAILHARSVAEREGVAAIVLGHVGDGNYHALFMVDPDDTAEVARAERITAQIVRYALARGGTCTGEHGIGAGKIAYLREQYGPAVDVMRALKATLDPSGILNPGKVLG
ncbi:MAG: FAD-binding protein [Actinomycetota bacterium]|nr:FAD-binding protein [Actinomycetota bacterium]